MPPLVLAFLLSTIAPNALSADNAPASEGLAGHWKLDEGDGTVASDHSASACHAAAPDVVTLDWVVGKPLHSLSFNGEDEYLETAHPDMLNLTGAFSIEFWIRPKAWAEHPSCGIVSKKRSDRDRGYVIYNNGGTPSKITLRVSGTRGATDLVSQSDVDAEQWQHWAITYDPAASAAVWYKNGRPDRTYRVGIFGDLTSAAAFQIGHSQTWNGYYCGEMAELKVYRRALAAAEVNAEYAATVAQVSRRPAFQSPPPRWRVIATRYPTADVVVAGGTVGEFGARGDGLHDDTRAFRNALRAMAESGGGTVFAPEGRYVLRGPLTVPSSVTLRGQWTRPQHGKPLDGTILMAYSGRDNQDDTPFISLQQCAGVKDLAVWYPEQDAGHIVAYPYCLRQAGFDGATIENVTLVNPYQGILIGPQNNELNYIHNVYGSPLATGIQIDYVTDTGRLEKVEFAPDIWSDSGLPGAPRPDGPHAAWMRAHGTALRLMRVDNENTAWLAIRGYRTGIELLPSEHGNPYLHLHGCAVTECDRALAATGSGKLACTDCILDGSRHGLTTDGSWTGILLFHSCRIRGSCGAALLQGQPEATAIFTHCAFAGEMAAEGGSFSLLGCTFDSPGNHLRFGRQVNVATVAGSKFDAAPRITGRNEAPRIQVSSEPVSIATMPAFPRLDEKSTRPAGTELFVATDPAWGAKKDGASDDTAAIQKALDAAAAHGGGIVFLPGGEYAVRGRLTVPSGVEIRGVYDVPHHTLGKGSTLRIYAGRNEETAAPFLLMQAQSGMRGLTFMYPEQQCDAIVPYPFTIQGRGAQIYVVNATVLNAYQYIDFMTHRCDGHYVDYAAGAVLKTGIAVGGGCTGGQVRNGQFIPHYWNRSPYPDCPGMPKGPMGKSQRNPVVEYQKVHCDGYLLGDCSGEVQFQNCVYGALHGIHFVAQQGRGASGIVLGHVTDGAVIGAAFERIGPVGIDFLDTWLGCIEPPGVRYVTCGPSLAGEVRLFNTVAWGVPQRAVDVRGGSLQFTGAHFVTYAPFQIDRGRLGLTGTHLAVNTPGEDELELSGAAAVTLTGNLTPYGMHRNAGVPSSAVVETFAAQYGAPLAAGAKEISVRLGVTQTKLGLAARQKDGESENVSAERGGRPCWTAVKRIGKGGYFMYYLVEFPDFKRGRAPRLKIDVDYFDAGQGRLRLVYDSSDAAVKAQSQYPGAWKVAGLQTLTNTNTWKTLPCEVPDALFTGRCNGGDFRLEFQSDVQPAVASVKITKVP
jgi:hypothetical protein